MIITPPYNFADRRRSRPLGIIDCTYDRIYVLWRELLIGQLTPDDNSTHNMEDIRALGAVVPIKLRTNGIGTALRLTVIIAENALHVWQSYFEIFMLIMDGQFAEAYEKCKANSLVDTDFDETTLGYKYLLMSVACERSGNIDEALKVIRCATTRLGGKEDSYGHISARIIEGVILEKKSDLTAAEEVLRDLLDASKGRASLYGPAIWNNLGLVREKLGDLDGAIECFENVQSISADSGCAIDQARALSNSSIVYELQGNVDDGFAAANLALEVDESFGYDHGLVKDHARISALMLSKYISSGDGGALQTALYHNEESFRKYGSGANPTFYATASYTAANLHRALGHMDEARRYYKEALLSSQEVPGWEWKTALFRVNWSIWDAASRLLEDDYLSAGQLYHDLTQEPTIASGAPGIVQFYKGMSLMCYGLSHLRNGRLSDADTNFVRSKDLLQKSAHPFSDSGQINLQAHVGFWISYVTARLSESSALSQEYNGNWQSASNQWKTAVDALKAVKSSFLGQESIDQLDILLAYFSGRLERAEARRLLNDNNLDEGRKRYSKAYDFLLEGARLSVHRKISDTTISGVAMLVLAEMHQVDGKHSAALQAIEAASQFIDDTNDVNLQRLRDLVKEKSKVDQKWILSIGTGLASLERETSEQLLLALQVIVSQKLSINCEVNNKECRAGEEIRLTINILCHEPHTGLGVPLFINVIFQHKTVASKQVHLSKHSSLSQTLSVILPSSGLGELVCEALLVTGESSLTVGSCSAGIINVTPKDTGTDSKWVQMSRALQWVFGIATLIGMVLAFSDWGSAPMVFAVAGLVCVILLIAIVITVCRIWKYFSPVTGQPEDKK